MGAFLISFLFIRTSARLARSPKVPWWPGSVKTSSGLHLHHLVFGIVLLMAAGFLGFVTTGSSPRNEILAGFFGVGMGLTLDEFALWIHLRDVYWAEEGRSSFDAVVVAGVLGALLLLGAVPFDLHHSSSIGTVIATILADVSLATIAIFKGKPLLGLFGLLLPVVSLPAALRLATPSSAWARRFYKADSGRLARSQARWQRTVARRRRFTDAIAGAPEVRPDSAAPPGAVSPPR